MTRDESLIFNIGPEKPEPEAGAILPSERTKFEAKKIFLFCEGKTEFYYFSGLKGDMVSSRLEIVPRYPDQDNREGPDVKKLTEQVLTSIRDGKVLVFHDNNKRSFDLEDVDEFHIIFDRDRNFKIYGSGRSKYDESIDMIDNKKISYYLSNYSFEVLILCHFMDLVGSPSMKFTGLKRNIMKSTGWTDYHKGDENIYLKTRKFIETAKRNASLLLDDKARIGIEIKSENSNPVTEIGRLIQYIEGQII